SFMVHGKFYSQISRLFLSPKTSVRLMGIASLVLASIFTQSIIIQETKAKEETIQSNEITALPAENIVCLSASGNSYNWASTLTWAAEIVRDAANKIVADARLNVSCVSGASSGSVFVATYGSLIQNKQLFNRPDFTPQSITKQEAEILVNSLLFMALAADYPQDVAKFYTVLDGEPQPDPAWWKSQYSLERIMLDFGTRVMLAQHLTQSDVELVERLEQFVKYDSVAELKSVAEDSQLRKNYRRVTFGIWQHSQNILDRLYKDARYRRGDRRRDRDDFRDNPQHPVRKALAQQPADGFFSLTYAELAFTESTLDYKKLRSSAPPADVLVPFIFANETTAKTIIESPFYQERVKNDDPYVEQYVICVVPDYYTMIFHGVKEPDLMPPSLFRLSPILEGATTNLAAGVSDFYQPLAEKNWHEQPRFKLITSTRFWRQGDKFLSARMGVAGGWVDSYVGGAATLYLGSGYAAEQSDSNLYFSTFSRQDAMGEFAKKVVKKYFAPQNSQAVIANIEEHRGHLPILMERYREFYPESTLTWQPIFVDYQVRFFAENKDLLQGILGLIDNVLNFGLNSAPAAITRQSNYLLARTTNVVRHNLGTAQELGYIYDRSYQDQFYGHSE
ncbi:MAG: hypothetical protein AAFN00_09275, partial [Cyanobacteria bacterium J06558_2]